MYAHFSTTRQPRRQPRLEELRHGQADRRIRPAPAVLRTSDFQCRQLAADVYLLTYTLSQNERLSRHSTIWRRVAGEWKIAFHQGTVVANH